MKDVNCRSEDPVLCSRQEVVARYHSGDAVDGSIIVFADFPQRPPIIDFTMTSELSRVRTADGVDLEGLFYRPEERQSNSHIDAYLLIHGTGSNFYGPGLLETFCQQVVGDGIACLRVNTRGHGIINRLMGQRLGGAAYESIDDCRLDIAAWTNYLVDQGFCRIGLVGHSMGGVKAIYSQAREPQSAIDCLVALSPPRFHYARLAADPGSERFRDDFRRATDLCANGHGDRLIHVQQPLSLTLTAQGFLEKYGPDDHYDFVRFAPQLKTPTLILLGTRTVKSSPAFAGLPDDLRGLNESVPNLTFRLVDGANMAYSPEPEIAYRYTQDWLSRITPES